ncbi:MAG: PEP-CTERM sorting domain-containing protein [Bryobacteraceae bacterium]
MRRTILAFLFVAALATLAYGASITFVPIPSNGSVSGPPESVVGWGFELTYLSDAGPDAWMVLTDSSFDGSQRYGSYVDYLPSNFYVVGPGLGPLHVDWDPLLVAGLGEFDIDRTAPPGLITGNIHVNFALFSEDPNVNPDSFLASGTFPVTVGVNVVPEPASVLLLGGAMLPFALAIWRRRKAHRA